MKCFNCGCDLTELEFCTNCGADVKHYKKIIYTSNRLYNEGLERASVRDLSGAVRALKECIRFNKNHIDARNLLGLVYYETGEGVEALSEWVISQNMRPEKNVANEYINALKNDQGRLENIKTSIRKFNKALDLCWQDSSDMAIIQLKKVISMNPNYVKARQLLTLLYIQKEEWERAAREAERTLKIDCGDLKSLRYKREIDAVLKQAADNKRGRRKKKEEVTAVYKTSGNETIIQPVGVGETLGINVFVEIAIGIIIGVCVSYFIILPARISSVRDEANAKASEYGAQLDEKNAEITDLEARITELQADIQAQKEMIDGYSGSNGTAEINDYLMAAAYAYMDSGQDNMTVDEYLEKIPADYLDDGASTEFLDLYAYLKGGIGASVAERFYEKGIESYNSRDYETAIECLTRAYEYDPDSDDALYYLGLAYYENGDVSSAATKFNELLEKFPDSLEAQKASQHLEEIGD